MKKERRTSRRIPKFLNENKKKPKSFKEQKEEEDQNFKGKIYCKLDTPRADFCFLITQKKEHKIGTRWPRNQTLNP